MKTERIDLLETYPAGGPDSARRFKMNGKPCSREEFQAVKNRAYAPPGRLECCETANKGGVWHFYSVAVLPL